MDPIYIPTRARMDMLTTPYKLFNRDLRRHVVLVVRPDEEDAYRSAHPNLARLVLPSYIQGISATRQWILNRAIRKEHRHLFMLDDDMTGLNRKDDLTVFGTVHVVDALKHMPTVLRLMMKWLDAGVAQVGWTDRVNSARIQQTRPYIENSRNLKSLFYRVDSLVDGNCRFDRVITMQDSDMTLQLMRKGFPSRTSIRWSYSAQAEFIRGGCATYRTSDVLELATRQMVALHPGIVTAVADPKNNAIKPRVSWAKAKAEGGLS